MPATPRPDTDLHTLARQRAHQLRREAMDAAWAGLAGLLRRAIPTQPPQCPPPCHRRDSPQAGRPATLDA